MNRDDYCPLLRLALKCDSTPPTSRKECGTGIESGESPPSTEVTLLRPSMSLPERPELFVRRGLGPGPRKTGSGTGRTLRLRSLLDFSSRSPQGRWVMVYLLDGDRTVHTEYKWVIFHESLLSSTKGTFLFEYRDFSLRYLLRRDQKGVETGKLKEERGIPGSRGRLEW